MSQTTPLVDNQALAKLLIKRNLLSPSQMEYAQEVQQRKGESFKQVLLRMNWITDADILKLEGELWRVPVFKPAEHLPKLEKALLSLITEHITKKYNVFPLWREGMRIWVAMVDPFDLIAIDDIHRLTKLDVKPMLASPADISDCINKYYAEKQQEKKAGEAAQAADIQLQERLAEEIAMEGDLELEDASSRETEEKDEDQLKVNSEDPPVVRFVNFLLSKAIDDKASDIHIEPGETGIKVRYRIDGALFELASAPKKLKAAIISRLKILSGMDIAIKRVPQDGAFGIRRAGKEIDFRVSTLPTIYGEKVVLRLLEKDAVLGKTLEMLDLGERNLMMFKKFCALPHGMMLVTGPTGSGKSTTLYTVLNVLNDPIYNITTVEDPCEYRLPGIQQVQVKAEIGFEFSTALRTLLRQDPDIIMIGEMRDTETAQIAVKAALTGHQVLSTLHTNDAPGAIVRLINMGVEPFLVASSVNMVVAQRLVKRICKKCKEPYEASIEEKEILKLPIDQPATLYKGAGCDNCRKTGYAGRAPVFEVLEMTSTLRRLMVEGASLDKLKQQAIAEGMETLRQCGFRKALEGTTTLQEVLGNCIEEH